MAVVIRNGVKFKDSSICYKIFCLYFEQHIPKETIPGILNISSTRVNETIKWLNGKFQQSGVIIVDEASPLTSSRGRIQQTLVQQQRIEPQPTEMADNEILKICTLEENNTYYLFVRTCKKFEEYLKGFKHIRTTDNLWGNNLQGEFYYNKLFDNYRKIDDVNRPCINENKINLGILRVKGISDGIKIEIKQLITQEKMKKAILAFKNDFKDYYISKVKNVAGTSAIDYTLKETPNDGVVRICANCHKEFHTFAHNIDHDGVGEQK
jgi:hypothetical protein